MLSFDQMNRLFTADCRRLPQIALLSVLALCLLVSCDSNGSKPDSESKIVTTYVQLPSLTEVEEGSDITIGLSGITNISSEDAVVLRSSANQDYNCPIISLKDGDHLTFRLAEGVASGNYRFYIRRGETNHYVGTTELSILKALVIEPDPGTNIYGIVTCEGSGVAGVLVSDGDEFATTDANGIYQLKSLKKWQYVFVIIPSGYEVPSQGVLPQFHATLTQSAAVAERKDFELKKSPADDFTLFVLGDMHLANRNDDIGQFRTFSASLNKEMAATPGKKYCLTLGDMTWDLYWYSNSYTFPEYLHTANENFSGVQFFHTMGNHDNDMNSVGDYNKSFRYTRDIAPTYYSFNIGSAHFVVLDNIDYNEVGTGSDNRDKYVLDYTAEQMAWLKKDLSYVDPGTPVFISSHAPVSRPNGATTFNNNYMNGANSAGEANMADFISAVSTHNVHFLSGHTHNLFNRKHSDRFSEHNEGAVCATWWWSGKLTSGIHVSQDGTPGGYGVWEFKGKNFTHRYQAAGHGAEYQFRAYDMNEVKKVVVPAAGGSHKDFTKYVTAFSGMPENTILINVWDFDEDWEISVTEDGKTLPLTRLYTYDPLHVMALSAPRCKSADSGTTPNFLTSQWPHFFSAKASSANSGIVVTVTDRNGKSFSETMSRPKAFNVSDYKNQ